MSRKEADTPATGLLAKYPITIVAGGEGAGGAKARCVDLFNAQKVLLATMREISGEKRAATAAGAADMDPTEKAKAERADVSRGLAKHYAYSTMHVPGGVVMQKVSSISFITPNGVKSISREAVEATLKEAKRPYITDLLEGSSVDASRAADGGDEDGSEEDENHKYMRVDAVEVLRGYSYKELDEMRFALVAMAELVSKQVYDEEGRLTGLAKRDMKRHFAAAEDAAKKEAEKAEEAAAAESSAAATSGGGDKPQKNLKPLLMDQCQTKWPHTPAEKAAVFTLEQDPNRPRHKPLFRASVNLSVIKRKFEGAWMPTKRDAENAASELALAFLMHMKPSR